MSSTDPTKMAPEHLLRLISSLSTFRHTDPAVRDVLAAAKKRIQDLQTRNRARGMLLKMSAEASRWCRPRLVKSARVQEGEGIPLEALIDSELEDVKVDKALTKEVFDGETELNILDACVIDNVGCAIGDIKKGGVEPELITDMLVCASRGLGEVIRRRMAVVS